MEDKPVVQEKEEVMVPAKEKQGCLPRIFASGGIVLSILFLLNLTAGIVEIPDNLPFIGNLDEVIVTTFLLSCLNYLGITIIPSKKNKD